MNALADATATLDPRWILVALLGALDLWAIGEVWLSRESIRDRVLWSGIVLVCPIIGCLFWFVLGPKAPRNEGPGGS